MSKKIRDEADDDEDDDDGRIKVYCNWSFL
jgi:hypothetical protein